MFTPNCCIVKQKVVSFCLNIREMVLLILYMDWLALELPVK